MSSHVVSINKNYVCFIEYWNIMSNFLIFKVSLRIHQLYFLIELMWQMAPKTTIKLEVKQSSTFARKFHLKEASEFSAETTAINQALHIVLTSNTKRFILHLDFYSVLLFIKKIR